VGTLRVSATRLDVAAAAFGAFATLLAAASIAQLGQDLALFLLIGTAAYGGAVLAFVLAPHVAFAATMAWFALLEAVKVQVNPLAGATKELIVSAAATAAIVVFAHRRAAGVRWRVDAPTLVLLGLFLGLYVFNLGGGVSGQSGYGAPWFHGTRLVSEPLLLLLAGMLLPAPRRSLKWASVSLIAAACLSATYGLIQQRLGVQGLAELGYDYGSQIREIEGRLRSFGTLGEPFAYAAFLTFALTALMFAFRWRVVTLFAGALLAAGLAASLVRTVVLILPAVAGIWLARRGHARFAVLLVAAAVVAAGAVFAAASGAKDTRVVQASPNVYLTLNGRTNIWKSKLGTGPADWALGRGVGVVGTASERATRTLTGAGGEGEGGGGVVDSGYFSTVADVGFLGLAILLGLMGRLFQQGVRAARAGDNAGWLALAFLAATALDAVTRESFTAFPTAYVSLMVVGLATGAWLNEPARGNSDSTLAG
jgi:hypothetical protein